MKRIEMTIKFIRENGSERVESEAVDTDYEPEAAGEHRLAHILGAELKIMVGKQDAPRHNARARAWLNFPGGPASIAQYFDVHNAQAMWLELANLTMGAEADLTLSRTFKMLEPAHPPAFEDDTALNDLYYLHDRKMNLMNQAVYALVKVQDLVNRLLHESLGGDLVNTQPSDWERTQLTRKNVLKGLETKRANGTLLQANYDAIAAALAIPENAPGIGTGLSYRNRLMHHLRPSVDYPMFFSALQSRIGEEVRDAIGRVVGRRHAILAHQPVEYSYADLHTAISAYLDAIVDMLDALSVVDVVRR